jgi:cytoskeletal protein RodZ
MLQLVDVFKATVVFVVLVMAAAVGHAEHVDWSQYIDKNPSPTPSTQSVAASKPAAKATKAPAPAKAKPTKAASAKHKAKPRAKK